VHVVDATSTYVMQQISAVHQVLDELGCLGKPRILVFNKIDAMAPDDVRLLGLRASHPGSIALSSRTRENLGALIERLGQAKTEHARRTGTGPATEDRVR